MFRLLVLCVNFFFLFLLLINSLISSGRLSLLVSIVLIELCLCFSCCSVFMYLCGVECVSVVYVIVYVDFAAELFSEDFPVCAFIRCYLCDVCFYLVNIHLKPDWTVVRV